MLGGAIVGAGIITGFKELYSAADESRKIAARTENVIAQMGNAANISAKQVGDLAGAISAKTGVDDEAIQSGQNLLLTFGNIKDAAGEGNDVFSQTSALMVDMSAAMGTEASGSAIQLGKALNDPIKGISALSRVGVSFTEDQKAMIRSLVEAGDTMGAQKIILGELERQFGGAAESMATPMDKVKVSVGNVAEQIGGYLVPAVDAGATWLAEEFLPAAEDVGGFLGDNLVPLLKTAADTVDFLVGVGQGAVGFFNDLPGPIQLGVGALGAFVALKGPVSTAFETIALKALYAQDAIGNARAGGLRGAAGGLVGFLGGPWGIALGAATVGLGFLVSALNDSDDATQSAENFQRELADALEESSGAINENIRALAAQKAEDSNFQDSSLLEWAEEVGVQSSRVTDALLGNKGAYDEIITAIDAYAQAQLDAANAAGTADSLDLTWVPALKEQYAALSGSLDGAIEKNRRLAGATQETATATGIVVPTLETFTAGLEASAEAASDASRETNMLKTALDVLTGASVSMIEVESSYQAALADASGALKDLNGTVLDGAGKLNLQSESGRATADVLLGVRDSGNQLIATMVQQGRSADEVGAAEARLRQDFINTAGQMGITGIQAETLADQILGIPGERKTTVTADTGQATSAISSLQAQIDGLRGRTVDIIARASMPDEPGVRRFGAASGAILPGWSPGKDVHHFFSPTGGYLDLSGGEAVMRPEFTAAMGSDWVNGMNAAARSGGINGVQRALEEQQFADGGITGAPVSIRAELNAKSYNDQMDGITRRVLDIYEPVTGFLGALNWAKSQVGKPYVWGGVGPGGYDCSGFMSAITNVIRGRSPYSRVGSTASFPWAGFGGGAGGMFAIGSTANAGGGIGHMAGTLLGVNVESTGGVGVKVGGSARGVNSGLFTTRASLYDNGGILPPGLTVAYNGTGKPETIRTAEQEAALRGPVEITGRLAFDSDGFVRLVDGRILEHKSASERNDRSWA